MKLKLPIAALLLALSPLAAAKTIEMDVNGLVCAFCAQGIEKTLKGFPATEPLVAKLGERIRIRFMNEGMMIHPMHLHGMHMTVIAKDGWNQPAPWKCDTLNVAPGDRFTVLVHLDKAGTWVWHCHILPHAENEQGMFGMVTALVVQ